MILVWWWDWWMLETMRANYMLDKPFFGLHCGTLWFLMNRCKDKSCDLSSVTEDDLTFICTELEELEYINANSIWVEVELLSWDKIEWFAFNDITIGESILDYFSMSIQLPAEIIDVSWTWLVVSTPLWSSGYATNLRTPLLPLERDIWSISWIGTGEFSFSFLQPQEFSISLNWKSKASIWLDGYNHVIKDVKHIRLFPWKQKATLAFHASQQFLTRRLLLAEEKMWR